MMKIAVGGGCHWCTEAVFLVLKGVHKVEQGWIASEGEAESFSEGVILEFDAEVISLQELIQVHLLTHASQSEHFRRKLYRSAVYFFEPLDSGEITEALRTSEAEFRSPLVTQVLPFRDFKPSHDEIVNYYFKNPQKPFCGRYIDPKLRMLLERFPELVDGRKLAHLGEPGD